MAIETPKLKLLLIQEDWKFADDSFNLVISDMDNKLLGIAHRDSNVHWSGWQTGHSYSKGDIVRTEKCKSNQYYLCVTNGISGVTEPTNNITGSVVDDGTVQWKICILGDSEANAAVDLFRGGMAYNKGQLVLYNEVLYRCKVGHVAAMTMELDADKWQQVDASLQPWKQTVYFFENDIVLYDNVIYKCTTAHTSGYTFDPTKWTPLSITLINDWQVDTDYLANQIVLYGGILYRALDTHTSDATDFGNDVGTHWEYVCAELPEWGSNISYVVGQIVLHNNRLYRCSTAHTTTSTFDDTKWTQILASPVIDDWQINTNYLEGQLVLNAGNLYRANQTHTSNSTSILPDISKWDLVYASVSTWDEAINYKLSQLVIYNNKLYKCNANHLSTTTFDHTKFDAVVSFPVIEEWQVSTRYLANQVVKFNNMLLIAIDAHTSNSTDIINDMTTPSIHWNLVYANIQTWQANTTYKVGTQVIYNNNLYQAKNTHTSGSTFEIAHWELIGQFDAFVYDWQENKYYYANQVILKDKELYRSDSNHISDSTWDDDKTNWTKISSAVVIDDWADNTEYLVNEVVIWNGVLYRCNTAHTSSTSFDGDKFTPVYANIAHWQASTEYLVDQLVMYNNQLYKCITAHTSASTFEPDGAKWQPVANNIAEIPDWASGIYYYQNQVVRYKNKLWRCLEAHTSITKDEQPDTRLVYVYDSGFLEIRKATALPVSATIDLGDIYTACDLQASSGGGYITVYGIVEGSVDNINFVKICDFAGRESGAGDSISLDTYMDIRYIRFTITSKSSDTGAFGFYGFKVWGDSSKWEIIVEDNTRLTYWQSNTRYDIDDIILHDNVFYRCLETHDSTTTFDSTKWVILQKLVIPDWKVDEIYALNQVVWYNNSLWRCLIPHESSSTENPDGAEVYTSTTNVMDIDDTTILPFSETVDLIDVKEIKEINFTEVFTDMDVDYTIEVSEDNITFSEWEDEEVNARYIKITANTINVTGSSPSAYLDGFTVIAKSDKWQEVSTMNTLTDAEIDAMFI